MMIDLPFLGDRTYVQGPTIVDMVLRELQPGFPLDIRFQAPILGSLEVRENPAEKANVAITFKKDGIRRSYGIFDAGQGNLNNRLPYDEGKIARDFSIHGKSIECSSPTDFSAISIAVLMNKVLMGHVFPKAEGKWWFTRLYADSWASTASNIKLTFDGGLDTRLVRSVVHIDDQPTAKIYFTLSPA